MRGKAKSIGALLATLALGLIASPSTALPPSSARAALLKRPAAPPGGAVYTGVSFFTDELAVASTTNLTAHTPNTGGSWAKATGITGDILGDTSGGRVYASSIVASYVASTLPDDADYSVRASHVAVTRVGGFHLIITARYDSVADSGYYCGVHYNGGGLAEVRVGRLDTGTVQTAGDVSGTFTYSASGTYDIELKVEGTTISCSSPTAVFDTASMVDATYTDIEQFGIRGQVEAGGTSTHSHYGRIEAFN